MGTQRKEKDVDRICRQKGNGWKGAEEGGEHGNKEMKARV